MSIRTALTAIAMLALTLAGSASAQTLDHRSDRRSSGSTLNRSGMSYKKMDAGAVLDAGKSMDYRSQYKDDSLTDLEQKLSERDWSTESSAWERACKTDTRDAYQKYAAMYPSGPHVADAYSRIIDIDVNDILSKPHENLPNWTVEQEDDKSKTCTVIVENNTVYPMTVMFSGPTSKSIVISAGNEATVTLETGFYKVAAKVPPATIRPYAGTQTMGGGRFRTGFYIVRL